MITDDAEAILSIPLTKGFALLDASKNDISSDAGSTLLETDSSVPEPSLFSSATAL